LHSPITPILPAEGQVLTTATITEYREGSSGSDAMEEEADDDFYGAGEGAGSADGTKMDDVKTEAAQNDLEEGEEESSEEEDEDVSPSHLAYNPMQLSLD
jgi:hypothetical protein